ncbi:MAG TPA: hypothetical protein VGU02_06215 [Gaiellaceae bacterium]|nr:hypothetical protein [Gaiellaceae bacterium]
MIRALVLYDEEPDADRYAEHVELCRKVPGATFRHGKITGAPMGEPAHKYYAEFEWPDKESFKQGVSSPEFMATGKDAMAMGKRMSVEFATIE